MKDLLSKIKTLDYKQFALNHGEKLGMGFVGLTVGMICLFLTSWASDYNGDPHKMEADAENVVEKLKQNKWTEEREKEFPYRLAANELPKVIEPLNMARFELLRDFSPKLYQKQQPAEEAKWLPPVDLLVFSSRFPMGTNPPASADVAEDEAKSPKGSGSKKKDKKGDDLLPASSAGDGYSAEPFEKASGRRFVTVLGVVEVRRQEDALRRALNVNTLAEVKDRLVYRAFKIQRQRAVPGPDPWPKDEKSWKDIKIDDSIAVILEASDQDAEVVPARYTNVEFTSPLPRRLDGEWEYHLIVHPRIPILQEEQRELEVEYNRRALEALKEAGETEKIEGGGTGFSRVQNDVNKLRRQVQGNAASSQIMNNFMDQKKRSLPPAGHSGPRGGSGAPAAGHSGVGPPPGGRGIASATPMGGPRRGGSPAGGHGGPSMMMGGMGDGMPGAIDTGAEIQLFRFFDFDVEPGECYRYRVKLIVENPTFEDPFVAQVTVAQGKFRESPWSAPSPPAVVNKDVEFGLVAVNQSKGHNDGADLNVIQFDSNLGSYLMDTIKVFYGSYVGMIDKKTLHLDFLTPTFKEEKVTFSSKDVLLDGTTGKLADSAASDLGLDPRKSKKLLEMAVTLNRFGEIEELDSSSLDALGAAKKRVEEEREPYKDIKEDAAKLKKQEKESALDEAVEGKRGKKGKKGGRERTNNPLKGGYSGGVGRSVPGIPGVGSPAGGGGVAPGPRGR